MSTSLLNAMLVEPTRFELVFDNRRHSKTFSVRILQIQRGKPVARNRDDYKTLDKVLQSESDFEDTV